MTIKLGQKVRDKVTGFEGTAVSRSEHLHGCIRIGIQQRVGADGKIPELVWLDEPSLDIVEDTPHPNPTPQGGAYCDPPRRADPR